VSSRKPTITQELRTPCGDSFVAFDESDQRGGHGFKYSPWERAVEAAALAKVQQQRSNPAASKQASAATELLSETEPAWKRRPPPNLTFDGKRIYVWPQRHDAGGTCYFGPTPSPKVEVTAERRDGCCLVLRPAIWCGDET
jgi:hypothetical protein